MNNELLLRKLRLIRDAVDDDPEEAGRDLDSLIEELDEFGDDHSW